MRVTQSMLSNNMLRNLMNSQTKMDTYLEQLYTGKKINRPSDDPVVAMKGMNFRGQVMEVEQYKRNIGEVHNWMDNSDAALDKANLGMQRIRELAVQASNSTNDADALKSISEEVKQLKEHMIDIVNTNVNGKFIFNGTDTGKPPAPIVDGAGVAIPPDANGNVPIVVQQNSSKVEIEVFKGTKLQANVSPAGVFTTELFAEIDKLITSLNDGDSEAIGASLGELDVHINGIINGRADLGARMNRLELIENRLDEQGIIAKKTMSENEDIHFEEAITNLITQESLYRAALSAGSRVIQPSLMDFLR